MKRWATEEFNLPLGSLPNDNYLKTWVKLYFANIKWKAIYLFAGLN